MENIEKTYTREDMEKAWKSGREQAQDEASYHHSNAYNPIRGTMDETFESFIEDLDKSKELLTN